MSSSKRIRRILKRSIARPTVYKVYRHFPYKKQKLLGTFYAKEKAFEYASAYHKAFNVMVSINNK